MVGGVAGVAIISILVWFIMRNKANRERAGVTAGTAGPEFFEKDATTRTPDVHEASGEPATYELSDNRPTAHPAELP